MKSCGVHDDFNEYCPSCVMVKDLRGALRDSIAQWRLFDSLGEAGVEQKGGLNNRMLMLLHAWENVLGDES